MRRVNARRLGVFLISAALAGSLQAAEEFDGSVPLELTELFLGLGEEGALYRDLPEDFPLERPPPGFEVLGTVVQGASSSTAYLRSELEGAQAREAISEALLDSGWFRQSGPFSGPDTQVGFIGPRPTNLPVQFCHVTGGFVSVFARPRDPDIFSVQHIQLPAGAPPDRACAQAEAGTVSEGIAFRGGQFQAGQLRAYMPRLVLPEEGNYYGRAPGTGTGGSGGIRDMETRTELTLAWEPARLYDHLAGQLDEQGWEREEDWSTARMAGGSWTREVDGRELLGVLSVIRQRDEEHFLRFRMVQLSE